MTIQPIAPQPLQIKPATGAATDPGPAVRQPVQTMDSNVFMSLLVTQLKNQNPSAPMDTNEMMAQTIQLSMMEKMSELTTSSKDGFSLQMRSAAAQLIGHSVGYTLPDGGSGSGIATAVSFAGAKPTVTIGELSIPLDSVTGIIAQTAS